MTDPPGHDEARDCHTAGPGPDTYAQYATVAPHGATCGTLWHRDIALAALARRPEVLATPAADLATRLADLHAGGPR